MHLSALVDNAEELGMALTDAACLRSIEPLNEALSQIDIQTIDANENDEESQDADDQEHESDNEPSSGENLDKENQQGNINFVGESKSTEPMKSPSLSQRNESQILTA